MPKKKEKSFAVRQFLTHFTDEVCREYLAYVRWKGKPRCPECGHNKNNYRYESRPIYKCVNCGTQFRATTGTIFEDSKLPLSKWFWAIREMVCKKTATSSYTLAFDLDITQKSAWFMQTNIRLMMGNKVYRGMLNGIVEVDEVYMVRDVTKKTKQGHGTNKNKIVGLRKRNTEKKKSGPLRMFIVDKVDAKTLHAVIRYNVEEGAWVMTDDWKGYNNLHGYKRGVVNHSKRQYVDGNAHTNSVEGEWSHLRKMIRVYVRPTPQHLSKYLNEFEFRQQHRNEPAEDIFKQALKQSNIRKTQAEIKENLRPLAYNKPKRTKK